jgi:peroxiredoxin
MLPLGTRLPAFSLPGLDGRMVADSGFPDAAGLVVSFICPHCPYVTHVRDAFAALAKEYQAKGVAVVAINANDEGAYPEDGPAGMAREAKSAGYTFPYLRDESQQVAKAFHAACTPDFFLFDRDRRLVYRGQFDGTRPHRPEPATGADLRAAIEALLAGREVPAAQRPSVGCNIKWKPGGAPRYT